MQKYLFSRWLKEVQDKSKSLGLSTLCGCDENHFLNDGSIMNMSCRMYAMVRTTVKLLVKFGNNRWACGVNHLLAPM